MNGRIAFAVSNTMKRQLSLPVVVGALLVWGVLATGETDGAKYDVSYRGIPGSSIKVEGTSTIHDWVVECKLISGTMLTEGEFPTDLSVTKVPELKRLPQMIIRVPVRSIKSGKRNMDTVMHAAMKQPEHPFIGYQLTKMTPSKEPREAGKPLRYDMVGDLTIVGVKKSVAIPVEVVGHENGGLRFTGQVKLKMTDYGIKPPAPKISLGLIRTGDEVVVSLEWITRKRVLE